MLYFLKTVGSSLNQLAFPFSNTGFFNKHLIVLKSYSAVPGPLSVNPGYCFIFLVSGSFKKQNYKIRLLYRFQL